MRSLVLIRQPVRSLWMRLMPCVVNWARKYRCNSQHLDAVESIVNTCVTKGRKSGDLERITNVEQQIDGINATLTQTATKSEVNAVASTVTQVSQGLDATNATLTQKAAQTQVDSQASASVLQSNGSAPIPRATVLTRNASNK